MCLLLDHLIPGKKIEENEQWYICALAIEISIITLFYDISINIIAFCKFFDGVVFFLFHFIIHCAPLEKEHERYSYICLQGRPQEVLSVKYAVCWVYFNSWESKMCEAHLGAVGPIGLRPALIFYNGFWKNLSIF